MKKEMLYAALLIVLSAMSLSLFLKARELEAEVRLQESMKKNISILPKGVPFYGNGIGFSYDDISPSGNKTDEAMALLSSFESINLSDMETKRYITIGTMIGCEYCCGMDRLVVFDGSDACSCDHSRAMRGLMKYLIRNYPEMGNDEVLEEIGKLKTLFFPAQMTEKAYYLDARGIELTYSNLASNRYKWSSDGGMVGAC